MGHHLYVFDDVRSTNSEAMALAQAGAEHGTVVVADCQTAGRGRLARQWYSPRGMNLYCSILIREKGSTTDTAEWLSWIPLATALATAEAVQTVSSIALSLKWPNDLIYDEKKVGGILCESSHPVSRSPIVVIGIGLNVNLPQESLPKELQETATSLFEIVKSPLDRNRLLAQLLNELEPTLNELTGYGVDRLRNAYLRRCATLGKQVRVIMGANKEVIGRAESISRSGALQLRTSCSSTMGTAPDLIEIHAADVIHLRGITANLFSL
ncbi:MAG: biotin--[acetyl-CoA-carboxylase] ligase [Nitrospira sp.]|nr:biotin--[acetyl-CoA-carboxylase] ligase [Nitrospira sp.]